MFKRIYRRFLSLQICLWHKWNITTTTDFKNLILLQVKDFEKEEVKVDEEGKGKLILKDNNQIYVLTMNKQVTGRLLNSGFNNVLFVGDAQISRSKSNIPFIKMDVLEIKKAKNSDEFMKKNKVIYKKSFSSIETFTKVNEEISDKEVKLKYPHKWYDVKKFEFIDVDVHLIDMDIDSDKGFTPIEFNKLNEEYENRCVLNKLDNGRYKLVMGLNACVRCFIMKKTIKAFITDMDKAEFYEYIRNLSLEI